MDSLGADWDEQKPTTAGAAKAIVPLVPDRIFIGVCPLEGQERFTMSACLT